MGNDLILKDLREQLATYSDEAIMCHENMLDCDDLNFYAYWEARTIRAENRVAKLQKQIEERENGHGK